MKRTLLLLLFTTCIGLVSCKKEVLIPNDGLPNQTILKYIAPNQWIYNSVDRSYAVEIPVSEIDRDTFENDDISLMISRGDNDIYDKMPYVFNGLSWSYDVTPGFVKIYLQTSGSNAGDPPKPTTTTRVKIVLITSSL